MEGMGERAHGTVGGSDNKGDGLASQPRRRDRVPGQPLLNRHQVGGVSHSPDGLFAQQGAHQGQTSRRGGGAQKNSRYHRFFAPPP